MDKIMKLLLQSSLCRETHFHSLVNSAGQLKLPEALLV